MGLKIDLIILKMEYYLLIISTIIVILSIIFVTQKKDVKSVSVGTEKQKDILEIIKDLNYCQQLRNLNWLRDLPNKDLYELHENLEYITRDINWLLNEVRGLRT